jgi:hypothetical protein
MDLKDKHKDKTFEAELDIVNTGIWLYENGCFTGNPGLLIYYTFALIATLGT